MKYPESLYIWLKIRPDGITENIAEMKHILIAGLSLFTLSLLSSCDKTYTCACTYAGFSDKNFEVKLESMRHNDAKVMCRDYATFVDSTSFYDISCDLK